MDCIKKIYKYAVFSNEKQLASFIADANKKYYENLQIVSHGSKILVIYTDWE